MRRVPRPPDSALPTLPPRAGPVVLAATGAALYVWTWGSWPDVLVDFGRELYTPWRLTEGEVLYRDIAWFNGPLSAYVNALLFLMTGPSLGALTSLNLGLLALAVTLIYRLTLQLSDNVAATGACLVFLTVFGFGQLVGIGNYNWIAPYSHELTHGIVLALLAVSALRTWGGVRSDAWVLAAGLFVGLAFLTKPEPFLAALVASGILLAFDPGGRGRRARPAATFTVGALAPPLAALLLMAGPLPLGAALRAVLGGWPYVVGGEVGDLLFYRVGMGLDQPMERLMALLWSAAGWAAALLPALFLGFALRAGTSAARWAAFAVAALEVAVLLVLADRIHWLQAARPLPLFVLIIAVTALASSGRNEERRTETLTLALAGMSFVLLLKMLLNARVAHYGFGLAMPATMLTVVALVGWLPALLQRRGAAGNVLRAASLGLLAVGCAAHLMTAAELIGRKTALVGSGADVLRADVRGLYVRDALAELEARLTPAGTLAVLPEGVMLNYLARRENPTPYLSFMPPEMAFFGERSMMEAFRMSPPDAVVLVHKDTSEYGYPLFGQDYGEELYSWLRATYVSILTIGSPPLQPGTAFGVEVLMRRD